MKLFSIINFTLIIGASTFFWFSKAGDKKIVYLNNAELINSFKLKKELEQDLNNLEANKKMILDSLLTEIKILGDKNPEESAKLKNIYMEKRSLFSNELDRAKRSSHEKIANQINEYVAEYGKDNEIDYILGATSDANIWYSKETYDATNDIIKYANEKYNGKK
jgi:Skp family chaperone for outer membrane proteins